MLAEKTPNTGMAPDIMASMVYADCVHIRWLDSLCPDLVMFGAYSLSFYEWRIVCLGAQVIMCFVCLLTKQLTTSKWKGVIFVFPVLLGSADTLIRWGGKL